MDFENMKWFGWALAMGCFGRGCGSFGAFSYLRIQCSRQMRLHNTISETSHYILCQLYVHPMLAIRLILFANKTVGSDQPDAFAHCQVRVRARTALLV